MPDSPDSQRDGLSRFERVFVRWWRRQSPTRQDRYATVAPLLSVLLFLAAITASFWYLRSEEIDRVRDGLARDTEIAQQQIRLHLLDNQEQLTRLARELATRTLDEAAFLQQSTAFQANRPELRHLVWLDAQRRVRTLQSHLMGPHDAVDFSLETDLTLPDEGARTPTELAFLAARETRQPVYSAPFFERDGTTVFQLQVPLTYRGAFVGVLLAEYSIDGLLRHAVPPDVARRHSLAVLGPAGEVLAATANKAPGAPALVYRLPLDPVANGLMLRGHGWRTSVGLIGNTLFWMVVALSVLTVWMLLASWRHMRRKSQVQRALVAEMNFRRAMENSMLTGMRAMDMDGRVSYVNPAFCAMTGFAEAELLEGRPPFPYWPRERIDENARLLQQQLQGRSPAGGIEVKVQRKDHSMFDARMYVSPLIDSAGAQTGWMTSMTNITEAKRVRDQLSASHERFTTVLEGLDALVSVQSVQRYDLLFANRSYRLWFGSDAEGHMLLAQAPTPLRFGEGGGAGDDDDDALAGLPAQPLTEAGATPREVFVETLQMWFDVRTRYLQWTDGSLAQMLVATDVTARRRAEDQARAQAERAQETSRLVTMGEMASSVAHELNQPLTAITNYCMGMVGRVQAGSIGQDDLVAALQKTARQAERAGQIIHRIRAFVKRSEPQRQLAQAAAIVEDAVELAGIEVRRRGVEIHTYVANYLPPLMVDPIMIEQVLMNLLKNAAEAIDLAKLPPSRRHIELRVVPRHTADEGPGIEFSVTDRGPGIASEILPRLYEAFFSTKSDGLGIGLSLCRSTIESHRGRLKAENLYNAGLIIGCRFTFTLPVDLAAAPTPQASDS
ncbi:MAG: PAS domain S-box protein [Proteobacteria bacterium]|nr:PAS domain S-box protein [Pseudomonadota bacterium]